MHVPPTSTGMSITTPQSWPAGSGGQRMPASGVAADVALMVALPRTVSPS